MNKRFLPTAAVLLLILIGAAFAYSHRSSYKYIPTDNSHILKAINLINQKDTLATYGSATEHAKSVSAQELKQEIISTYRDFISTRNQQQLMQLSAYTSVYMSSNPYDSQISDINDSLVTEFGPCYGLPGGQCRE